MTRRIPHAETEVRQAFQKLTKRSDVLTTGADGELLYGQGVGEIPVWGAAPSVDHGDLDGLDGDDHVQYHTDARGDARYFTEAEHLNTSAGAADAGKPIKLDAAGVIDSTMLDIVETDEKVGIDSGATAGYLGAAAGDGVLRTSTGLSYADGGDFVTLALSHLGIESLTDPGADRIMFWDDVGAAAVTWLVVSTGLQITTTNLTTNDGEIVHGNLSGYVADEHVAHTGVTLTAGSGLAGGGDISTGRTFDLDINSLAAASIAAGDFVPFWDITATATNKKITFANFEGTIDHGSIAGIGDDDHTIYLLADGSRDLTGNLAVDSEITIDGRDISADGATLDTIDWLTVGTGLDLTGTTLSTEDTEIVHDDLSGYVADEHVAHAGVSISTAAGSGLSGGGTIASTRTLTLDINGLAADTIVAGDSIPFYDTTGGDNDKTTFAGFEAALTHGSLIDGHNLTTDIDHDTLTNYAANQHINWTNATDDFLTTGNVTCRNSGNDTATLGSELVTNGTFASDLSSWTIGDGGAEWVWDATGKAEHDTGNTSTFYQGIALTNGGIYHVEFTLSSRTAGSAVLTFGALAGSYTATANRTYVCSFRATATDTFNLTFTPLSTFDGMIDDVTVKQITGTSGAVVTLEDNTGTVAAEIRTTDDLESIYIGKESGQSNTTGYSNLSIGYRTLFRNATGYRNIAIGYVALYSNIAGYINTAIGGYALYSNTIGHSNTAIGGYTLYRNTIGIRNLAIGFNALYSNISGANNVAVGYYNLNANTIGSQNVAIGFYALDANTEGGRNIAIGSYALRGNTLGDYNVGIGYAAGRYIADGSTPNEITINSIYLGYNTKASADEVDNEVVIGYGAIGKGTNTAIIGNSALTTLFVPTLSLMERSADPTEPAEGECVIWMSDGTGKGDDGDVMIASKAAGQTNVGTLFDHSGGAAW